MIVVAKCPQDQLGIAWPVSVPHIQKAVEYSGGRYEVDDVFDLLTHGLAQLFLVSSDGKVVSACVTQLNSYPRKLMLNVLFLGGDGMLDWLSDLIDLLGKYAVSQSANGVEMYGRAGWSKVLTKFGFKRGESICMELAVE